MFSYLTLLFLKPNVLTVDTPTELLFTANLYKRSFISSNRFEVYNCPWSYSYFYTVLLSRAHIIDELNKIIIALS